MEQDNEKLAESSSSCLRKKCPWDWENEKLTDEVLSKIVKSLPSYAKDVAYWHPKEPDFFYWFEGLKEYCRVIRDYFVKAAKEAPDSLKPKLSEIAEEAFDLIDNLMKCVDAQLNPILDKETGQVFYSAPCSWNEVTNKWDTLVNKLNLYMSSGKQEEKPIETEQKNKDAKREREGMIQPKPPEILQKILWILKYGRRHWKLVSLAILIVLCIWILSKINLFS